MAANLTRGESGVEVVGYDWGQLVGPAVGLATDVISNYGTRKAPKAPPAPKTPAWVMPVAIGGGALMLMVMVLSLKK